MAMEEISLVISAAAEDALSQLDTMAQKLQGLGKAADQMKDLKVGVSAGDAMQQLGALGDKLGSLEGQGGLEVKVALSAKEAEAGLLGLEAKLKALGEGSVFPAGEEGAKEYLAGILRAFQAAVTEGGFAEKMGEMGQLVSEALSGVLPDGEMAAEGLEAYERLFGREGLFENLASQMAEMASLDKDTVRDTLKDLFSGLELSPEELALEIPVEFDYDAASGEELAKRGKELNVLANQQAAAYAQAARQAKVLADGEAALCKAKGALVNLSGEEQASLKAAIELVDGQGLSTQALTARMREYGAAAASQTKSVGNRLSWLAGQFTRLNSAAKTKNVVQVDTREAERKTTGLLGMLLGLGQSIGQASGSAGRRSGGGGGSAAASAARAESRRKAEEARKEAIQKDYEMIAHKKHMNEITLEQELKMLEEIRQKHKLNAEEIMEWEEKVYDLKKEIRERDAESVNKLGDSVIKALGARYQAMLDAEIERLDASRKAWSQWRDDSVRAIEDQIAALEELQKTEDREKQDQEELRKIAKLTQEIEFEQDDYNRMKLQQQLEQTLEGREERLRKQALEDEKNALRQEIEAINDRAEAQLQALDDEQESIEAAYKERMGSAALTAEAEKLMLRGSQKEILGLLAEYAPDYDALGQTLGEKLLAGFQNKVGSVVDWFQKLNASMVSIQNNLAAEALAAAAAFQQAYQDRQSQDYSTPATTVVNQTVNFNEPVETAGDAARRVAQANEELGALLYGG